MWKSSQVFQYVGVRKIVHSLNLSRRDTDRRQLVGWFDLIGNLELGPSALYLIWNLKHVSFVDSGTTCYTISSHQLLNSGLSVSPFFVCWDAWLCRSPPPWWVQRPFPAEHGSLWSLASLFSPLLHPVLGVSKTPFGMVNKPRWIHPSWSRPFIWRRLQHPYWLLEYCPWLYRTVATVHFSQLSALVLHNISIFSGTTASSWFLSIFLTSSGCLLFCCTVLYCAITDTPATSGLSTILPLLLQPNEYYGLVLLYSFTITTSAAA